MGREPRPAHQRVKSGPCDEFTKCENGIGDINCNFPVKVTAIPKLSTRGRTVFTEHLNNRRLGDIMSVNSLGATV